MDLLTLLLLAAAATYFANQRAQRQRIALLGRHLQPYRIEPLMEQVTQGYLRALGEGDPARQEQVWAVLRGAESELCEQLQALAQDFGQLDAQATRTSRLPLALPHAERWWPSASFDTRALLRVHADGLRRAHDNAAQHPPKRRAHTLMAELFLFQHSCHWFCRSQTVASARLLARHHTRHDQVLEAVTPETRRAYLALVAPGRA